MFSVVLEVADGIDHLWYVLPKQDRKFIVLILGNHMLALKQ
jgi:hypothetical protein